ncbi:MAG: hypothetical protein R3A13_07715 [Bdellovibrionota bacterium]
MYTRKFLNFFLTASLILTFSPAVFVKPLTESTTGLSVDAPKKFKLSYSGGVYTIKKKRSKTKANFIFGKTPLGVKATADDFINTSGMNVKKYSEVDGTVLLKGKLNKKNVQVRFRPVGDEMEFVTYFGKKKKKKKKRALRSTRASTRITVRDLIALDNIIRSRSGGRRVFLPVNIPMRRITASDGTNALIPNLPGWTGSAGAGGVISAGHPTQGIVTLGVPHLVFYPGTFFAANAQNTNAISNFVTAGNAIAQVWPQQVAKVTGGQVQVLAVQQLPNTNGWLGPTYFSSGLFAVRFRFNGLVWDALFVSGSTGIDGVSWLWYHSYIAVPVGSSPAMGNALVNSWTSWDNSNANANRFTQTLNTILTTPPPGNPIDQDVFDRIHQKWVDYIKQ